MKVVHVGKTYLIQFRYVNNHKFPKTIQANGFTYARKLVPSKTYCNIYLLMDGEVNKVILSEGISICSAEDQFVKDKGRRLALQNALSYIDIDVVDYDKLFKQNAWNKYDSMYRLPGRKQLKRKVK